MVAAIYKTIFRLRFFVLLIVLLLCCSCGRIEESVNTGPVIARAGERDISWKQLERSYNLDPKWGRGLTRKEAYLNQVEYRINQALYAQQAQAMAFDEDSAVINYLKFLEQKEVIKALYREDIASQINISDAEYQQAYRMIKRKVKYRYIYTPDSLRAIAYSRLLATIAEPRLLDETSDSKGSSDWLTFGEMEPALENIIFDMKPEAVSPPVRLENGFLIVQLLEGRIDRFMSEMDFAEKKSKLRKVMFDRWAAALSNSYIKSLMLDKQLQLQPKVFFALARAFEREVTSKTGSTPFPVNLSREEIGRTRASLKDLAGETVITFRDGSLTVAEFLSRLADMPSGLRPNVAMAPQLKDAIGVVVRNEYLYRRGVERNLHKRADVLDEVKLQHDELLARRYLGHLQQQIIIEPHEVQAFREKPAFAKINNQLGSRLDDSAISDILHDKKLAEIKLHEATLLRETYSVSLDTTALLQQIKHADEVISENPVRFAYRELFN